MPIQDSDELGTPPITVALIGASGSGKTYSALLLARGLVGPSGKIGLIETQGGQAKIYKNDPKIGKFRYLEMHAPFSPSLCIARIDELTEDGCGAIVFDTLSSEHDDEGGLLDMADEEYAAILARNPNNRAADSQKWIGPKREHKKLLRRTARGPAHIVMTIRETLSTDFTKKPPQSVLATVTEKNTLFEVMMHARLDESHRATWSRVPELYRRFIQQGAPITAEMGSAIAGNAPATQPSVTPDSVELTPDDVIEWLDSEHINDEEFEGVFERLGKPLPERWQRNLTTKQCEWILSERGKAAILAKRNGI